MKRTWNAIGLAALVASMICLGGCGESAPEEVPAKDRQGYGKTYTFALNYPAGEYALKMNVDMDETLRVDGTEVLQTSTMITAWMSVTVPEHKPTEGFSMDMKYTRYKMEWVQQGNTLIDYDSDVPSKSSDGPTKAIGGALLNLAIKADRDKDGNVLSATGMEGYFELLTKDPVLRDQLDGMEELHSNEAIALSIQAEKEVLPTSPVTLDDTWPVAFNDGLRVLEGTARLYEVVSTPEGDLATIKMTGKAKKIADMPKVDFRKSSVDFECTIEVYVATGVAKTTETKVSGMLRMRHQREGSETDMTRKMKMTMEKVK